MPVRDREERKVRWQKPSKWMLAWHPRRQTEGRMICGWIQEPKVGVQLGESLSQSRLRSPLGRGGPALECLLCSVIGLALVWMLQWIPKVPGGWDCQLIKHLSALFLLKGNLSAMLLRPSEFLCMFLCFNTYFCVITYSVMSESFCKWNYFVYHLLWCFPNKYMSTNKAHEFLFTQSSLYC